jgi:hypothetical protein
MSLSTADRLEIHELVALHGHLTDDRRFDTLDLLMTVDGAYDVTDFGLGVVQGLPALTALFEAAPGNQPRGHHVTNVIVSADQSSADRATVRSKGLAVMPDGRADTVTYHDDVVRTPSGWRIERRKVVRAG